MYLRPKYVRGQYTTRLTGPKPQTPAADPHGWHVTSRVTLVQGPPRGSSGRRRSHAASARARVAVPALGAGLLLHHHEDAYQCVSTCPGARGWGEAWVAGAEPSLCTENGSACGGGVQHVPATARGRLQLGCINHGGEGGAQQQGRARRRVRERWRRANGDAHPSPSAALERGPRASR